MRGALGNALTQGIGMATGLQKKFDWAGVAAAGVEAGVTGAITRGFEDSKSFNTSITKPSFTGVRVLSGGAGLIVNAATRSLVNGSDFGDNILAALPDFIGQTIGNMVAEGTNTDADNASMPKSTAKGTYALSSADSNSLVQIKLQEPLALDQIRAGYEKFMSTRLDPQAVRVAFEISKRVQPQLISRYPTRQAQHRPT